MKKIVHILLVLLLVFGCATTKGTKEEKKKEGPTFGQVMKFLGAVCLFGLIMPGEPEEEEIVHDISDPADRFRDNPVYRIEKKEKK